MNDHDASLALLAEGGAAPAWMTERTVNAHNDLSPPATILTPTDGNLHEFFTVGGCAIFDVLAPPYNDDAGRPCVYYQHELSPKGVAAAPVPDASQAEQEAAVAVSGSRVEVLLRECPEGELADFEVVGGPSITIAPLEQ